MFTRILRVILGDSPSPFESYYQSVLQFAAADVAPSISEARADYLRRRCARTNTATRNTRMPAAVTRARAFAAVR